VRRGAEAVTRDLLDTITSSYATERQYAKAVAAQRKQRQRTTGTNSASHVGQASGA
jgi:hypothetical protein